MSGALEGHAKAAVGLSCPDEASARENSPVHPGLGITHPLTGFLYRYPSADHTHSKPHTPLAFTIYYASRTHFRQRITLKRHARITLSRDNSSHSSTPYPSLTPSALKTEANRSARLSRPARIRPRSKELPPEA